MTSGLSNSNGGCWSGLYASSSQSASAHSDSANSPFPQLAVGFDGLNRAPLALLTSAVPLPSPHPPKSVKEHMAAADCIVVELKHLAERARKKSRHHQELAWLAANRKHYPGQWVALDGEQLLAAGSSVKGVFAQVANHKPTPLVIFLAEEELPFAGW